MKQNRKGKESGQDGILSLTVGSLNLTAELPHFEAKGLGFCIFLSLFGHLLGLGIRNGCDGADSGDDGGGTFLGFLVKWLQSAQQEFLENVTGVHP